MTDLCPLPGRVSWHHPPERVTRTRAALSGVTLSSCQQLQRRPPLDRRRTHELADKPKRKHLSLYFHRTDDIAPLRQALILWFMAQRPRECRGPDTCTNVKTIWTLAGGMGGMQVLRRGGGGSVPSLITTQMVQGPFSSDGCQSSSGGPWSREGFAEGVWFNLKNEVRSQKHQVGLPEFVLLFNISGVSGQTLGWPCFRNPMDSIHQDLKDQQPGNYEKKTKHKEPSCTTPAKASARRHFYFYNHGLIFIIQTKMSPRLIFNVQRDVSPPHHDGRHRVPGHSRGSCSRQSEI